MTNVRPTLTPLVHVDLGPRSYDIHVGTDTLAGLPAAVAARCHPSQAIVITDNRVDDPHARSVTSHLTAAGVRVDMVVVPAGESSKSVAVAADLWQRLLTLGVDRRTVIVAVGGGVVGDLAGFVAATYARGLALVQVPTTLLAQVDSSVGGKVGINLPGAKNMVGAFWQPELVWIDTQVLATLPPREYRSGLAEVVKYGVIFDAEFFAYLEAHVADLAAREPAALEHVILHCCRLKANVVESDERETSGARAALNYGHTFGHALEMVTGYGSLLHGEAVAIGMVAAARLSRRLGAHEAGLVERQKELLTALGLPTTVPNVDHLALLTAMQRDKKVEHGRLRFVLVKRIGQVEVVEGVESADVRAVLAE
ncbi:MAG TPA: 3-dehydroquinate synthase [Pirellulales bacterium]|nr:3-dehydroquinate synthase [Pirellulales bacterium]